MAPSDPSSGSVKMTSAPYASSRALRSSLAFPGTHIVTPTPVAAPSIAYATAVFPLDARSEEHTSELQSRRDLVCRLLLEKKKNQNITANDRHLAQFLSTVTPT